MSSSLSNQQVFTVYAAICGSYRNINRLLIAGLFQDSGDSSRTEPCTICHTVLVGAHNKYWNFHKIQRSKWYYFNSFHYMAISGQANILSTDIWNHNYKSLKRWPSQRQCTLGWKASLTLDNALTLTYDRAI